MYEYLAKLKIQGAKTKPGILEALDDFAASLNCELTIDIVCEKSLLDAAWFYRDEAKNPQIEDSSAFLKIADMLEFSAEKIKLIK